MISLSLCHLFHVCYRCTGKKLQGTINQTRCWWAIHYTHMAKPPCSNAVTLQGVTTTEGKQPSKLSISWTSFLPRNGRKMRMSPWRTSCPSFATATRSFFSMDIYNEHGISSLTFETPTGNKLMLRSGLITKEKVQSSFWTSKGTNRHLQFGSSALAKSTNRVGSWGQIEIHPCLRNMTRAPEQPVEIIPSLIPSAYICRQKKPTQPKPP